jgi:hypothetical protein
MGNISHFCFKSARGFQVHKIHQAIKNTDFAKLDTAYYSPLCALLTLGGIMIEMMK